MATIYDIEESARIVLMEMFERHIRSMTWYVTRIRDVHPDAEILDLNELWDKYMGREGRVSPTHDLETGEMLCS